MDKCIVCGKIREFEVQIGKDSKIVFCNHCGTILAHGIMKLVEADQIALKF